ncbi:divergent AAA domain protein [Candidatus Methanoplasma termitum]|uniref:Divergent AAA domain protein n=1 Tax=Candidatus Methanoplasma termitum TaxID=1577791 RepID=A0A0A7LG70_9ARCH|nr:ATP-binding protein [Candidatus Methanoplasma termitum]AIZ57302.1 divergent AAA domain protein [Candidatus Methanoplasma termitum]MCL2334080.1 ATP-binding protein [Candidatus Methanoplasma sp.]
MQETNRIEFERELNERFVRTVVSFLNYTGGGEIIVGIDDNGAAIGVDDPDTVQRKAVDLIRNNIRPQTLGLFDVVADKIDDNDIVRVIVSCGQQRPYYIRKKGEWIIDIKPALLSERPTKRRRKEP